MTRGSIGLVLSGGGARGAFEVGVLRYIAEELPELLERVRIITGTSAGAVNAAFVASRGLTPQSVAELEQLWRGLRLDDVISLSHWSAFKMLGAAPLRLLRSGTKSPITGLLDGRGLFTVVGRETKWSAIGTMVDEGRFDAVAVVCTDIARGEAHVFVDAKRPPARISESVVVPSRIELRHVLASAAMPLLFSPVEIQGRWYMDGGVRNNTPLAPALHLGAEALLIVNTRGVETSDGHLDGYPGIGQIVGKVLDSIFLDRVGFDLDRLTRINDMIAAVEALGEESMAEFHRHLVARGRPRYRRVPVAQVSPAADLGAYAADYIRGRKSGSPLSFSFVRALSALFEDDVHASGDAASFLLFDGGYTGHLIDLGFEHAARSHALVAAL